MAVIKNSLIVMTSAIALAACAKKPPEVLPPTPGPAPTATQVAPQQPINNGPLAGSQADFLAQVGTDRIFFDTDRFNIDAQDQNTLQNQARWLQQYPNKPLIIEGHADERGTRDYNLALGERRANAAKNYLVSLGIQPARIRVVSYGKERPQDLGSNENAWAQNRRAVTVTID